MIRLALLITAVWYGYHAGGWYGLLCMTLLVGVLGLCLPHKQKSESRTDYMERIEEQRWEKIDHARRGDPTRPDDHPLLLTHEVRRMR